MRVHDLLFALARDARINVDIHPGINGYVTLNAIDQTLPQLLNRIAKQVDMRFEIDGPNLTVMPDTPFLRNYPVDYVNMSRDTTGSVSVTSQLAGVTTSGSASTASSANNNSTTKIDNKAQNRFWETLVQNIKDILRETDKILPEGSVKRSSNRRGHKAPRERERRPPVTPGAQHAGRAIDRRQSERSDVAERRHDRRQAHHVP